MTAMRKLKLSLAAFWSLRNPRERLMLSVAAAVLLLGLIYALLIDPALSGRDKLNKDLPQLRQQAAALQAMAREAASLSGRTAAPVPPMTRENLEAALQRKGLKAQSVVLTGDFAKLQFTATPFAGLLDWLADAQRSARLGVVEANINALAAAGMVDATLTLRQQKAE